MYRSLSIIVLSIGFSGCAREKSTGDFYVSPEQEAINFLFDSLYRSNPFEDDDVILSPPAYDSSWFSKGFLTGYVLIADSISQHATTPYYDQLDLVFFVDEMPDSVVDQAKDFIADYRKDIGGRYLQVQFPREVIVQTRGVFESLHPSNTVFIEVKRHLTSKSSQLVEIEFVRYTHSRELSSFSLYVWLDSHGKPVYWVFS